MSQFRVPDKDDEATAIVIDDEGEMHEITYVYTEQGENRFEVIENEAKEQGIRYADTMMFQRTKREVK